MADVIPLPHAPPDPEKLALRDDTLTLDLDDGLRFAHLMGQDTRRTLDDLALTVLALVEELKEQGVVDADSLAQRLPASEKTVSDRVADHVKVSVWQDLDKYTLKGSDVPCSELIPLCRGRCCTLHFPLSRQDLDERVIKWNYSRPYTIRQRETDHYCVHNDPETRGCTAYLHRPAVCRTYDCRNDKRIWVDYEKRIPAVDPQLEPKVAPVPMGFLLD